MRDDECDDILKHPKQKNEKRSENIKNDVEYVFGRYHCCNDLCYNFYVIIFVKNCNNFSDIIFCCPLTLSFLFCFFIM